MCVGWRAKTGRCGIGGRRYIQDGVGGRREGPGGVYLGMGYGHMNAERGSGFISQSQSQSQSIDNVNVVMVNQRSRFAKDKAK